MAEPSTVAAAAEPTLDQVLAQGDREFVQAAYQLVLKRDADPDGLATYTAVLRAGERKALVLEALLRSDEARTLGRTVAGLEAYILAETPRQPSLLQRVGRRLAAPFRSPDDEPVMRALRAMDNRLARLESDMRSHFNELHGARAELQQAVESLRSGLAPQQQGTPQSTPACAEPVPSRGVPPRVGELLRGMQRLMTRRNHRIQ